MEKIFTEIYKNSLWGNNNQEEYNGSSGTGSDIEYNVNSYVPFLKNFINNNNIKSVIDLGCGDFRCGELIYNDINVSYTGYDAYKNVIEYNKNKFVLNSKINFIHLDFYNNMDKIEGGELCILKDVLQHWSTNSINIFLDYLITSKKFKYILICNCCYQEQCNTDIKDGEFRYLSCDFLPLKKFNPVKIFNYKSKEISIIKI
jgi:SAM-dependent methyltransferase